MKLDESTIAALGASLRRIDTGMMQPQQAASTKERIWYQGGEPYFNVTIERTKGQITWLQITLRGRVISWRSNNTYVQTGETDELDIPAEVAYYSASKTIRDGASVNWPLVTAVQAILAQRPEDILLTEVSNLLKNQLAQQ